MHGSFTQPIGACTIKWYDMNWEHSGSHISGKEGMTWHSCACCCCCCWLRYCRLLLYIGCWLQIGGLGLLVAVVAALLLHHHSCGRALTFHARLLCCRRCCCLWRRLLLLLLGAVVRRQAGT